MEITLIQSLLIGLWTAACYSGMLFGIYTNRSIFLSFGVGLILGDIPTALRVGAIAELAFMGFGVGAGGTVPPNPIGPGIIGTLMAITNPSISPESALALSMPFAVAIQFLQTFIYTLRAGAPASAKKALENLNFKSFKLHANLTLILFLVVGFSLGFLGAFSMEFLTEIVNVVPQTLLKGLNVAGGMLPAIGFAMILSVMVKKEVIPFVILGYLLAAYFKLPVIGIALLASVFAIKEYNQSINEKIVYNTEVGNNDWI